ncbi:MAG: hypothetical protein JWQ29_1039, partial [Phenylobacterium sp.]|nr:hypothetical protein [Phenylobacterium sp.]
GLTMIREAADTEGGSLDRLAAMIRGHVGFFCNNVAKTTVYLHELRRLDPAERRKLLCEYTYRNVFQEVIEKGQEEGSILPHLEPKLTAQAMLSSLNSVYHWYRSARSPTAIAEYFVLTLLRGHATDQGLLATYAKPAV